jgi:hypothetical protein
MRCAPSKMWASLPDDLIAHILRLRAEGDAATAMQKHWRRYRTRVLVGRFKMLRCLRVFREFNRDLRAFLERSRL